MTGTAFVLIVVIILVSALVYTAYIYFFVKSKNTTAYTFEDEKKFRASGIQEIYGSVFIVVLKSLQDNNPWFKKVIRENDYLNEALTITTRLEECKKKLDVFKVIDDEFFRWRGYGSLNPKFYDRVQAAADEVWVVWEKEIKE